MSPFVLSDPPDCCVRCPVAILRPGIKPGPFDPQHPGKRETLHRDLTPLKNGSERGGASHSWPHIRRFIRIIQAPRHWKSSPLERGTRFKHLRGTKRPSLLTFTMTESNVFFR